jgi:hypothetical protein
MKEVYSMSVTSTSNKAGPYLGNGVTTQFNYNFPIFALSDVKVYITDLGGSTTLVTSGYQVVPNNPLDYSTGGHVTYPYPSGTVLPTGYKLTLLRVLPLDQPNNLRNVGNWDANVFENMYDRLTMMIQQINEVVRRANVADITQNSGVYTYPVPAPGKAILWNASGTGFINQDLESSANNFNTQIISNVATGVAPISVTSITECPNLHAATATTALDTITLVVSNWISRTSPENNAWSSVCWSPELGLFVAVATSGSGNRVMTSPDGLNWTSRSSAADNAWSSVCWSPELGLFVAVAYTGTGNRVMTSPDGLNWTSRSSAADNAWRSVCWSPELGLFVAVATSGSGNRVMTSPDGLNWTSREIDNNAWTSVFWSSMLGVFVTVGYQTGPFGKIAISYNGLNWISRTSPENNPWRSVCWSPELGLFVAVAEDGTKRVMTSLFYK